MRGLEEENFSMSRRKFESRGQKTERGESLVTREGIGKRYEQHFVCELCWSRELHRIVFIKLEFRLIDMLLFGRLEAGGHQAGPIADDHVLQGSREMEMSSPHLPSFLLLLPPSSGRFSKLSPSGFTSS